MLLRLLMVRQLKPGGYGLVSGAHPRSGHRWVGNSWLGLRSLGQEAMVKVYGVAMAMPQG